MTDFQSLRKVSSIITQCYNAKSLRLRYEEQKTSIRYVLILCLIFFILIPIDFLVLSNAEDMLRARITYAPSLILLALLTYVSRSASLFYFLASVVYTSAGALFVTIVWGQGELANFYCLVGLVFTFVISQSLLQIPSLFYLPFTWLVTFYYSVASYTGDNLEWFIHAGSIISICFILSIASILNDIQCWKEKRGLTSRNVQNQQQKRWNSMISRLLRHEIGNQLIALKSSLDMLLQTPSVNTAKIRSIENKVGSLQRLINEIALASDIQHENLYIEKSGDIFKTIEKVFATNNIALKLPEEIEASQVKITFNPAVFSLAIDLLSRQLNSLFKKFGLWGEVSIINDETHKSIAIRINQLSNEFPAFERYSKTFEESFAYQFSRASFETQGMELSMAHDSFSLKLIISIKAKNSIWITSDTPAL